MEVGDLVEIYDRQTLVGLGMITEYLPDGVPGGDWSWSLNPHWRIFIFSYENQKWWLGCTNAKNEYLFDMLKTNLVPI